MDLIKTKMQIMREMDNYLLQIGDDDIYDIWIETFPDECDDTLLHEMAENDSIWLDVIDSFGFCCRRLGLI